jgi:predicted Zn-dependent peptidase
MPTSVPLRHYTGPSVSDDPIQAQIHTLSNGMQLFMSVNPLSPRIQANVAVRAGSKHDPSDTTGLAHYLEHMLFKGTDRLGALNWEEESELLRQIADLYEQHRKAADPLDRKKIYAQIDRLSSKAAKFVASSEYDKLATVMGAKGTNAYTSVEQTVFINDIPSNELERWMKLESERFNKLVLRLFHTELETVYEEYNMNQDRDARKVSKVINRMLYPTHPYGLQTTIGEGEHLKNPSHYKIYDFFATYYVPNNMAIILAGDFDPKQTIDWAEQYFGTYNPKPLPPFQFPEMAEATTIRRAEVVGNESAYLDLGWRLNGAQSDDALKARLIKGMLFNRKAGLIDLNLLHSQLLLDAGAYYFLMEDFSALRLYGRPRNGQTLEEVEELLIKQIRNIQEGHFPDWLPEAVIRDYRLTELKNHENNSKRAFFMTYAFVLGVPWHEYVQVLNQLSGLTKDDLIQFARQKLKDNYAVVYKRHGEDQKVEKVDKPNITPIELNRSDSSEFASEFLQIKTPDIQPQFLDYQQLIQSDTINDTVPFHYVRNSISPIFSMDYILEMGRNHDPLIPLAISYLPYLSTKKFSSQQLKQEFFRLGLDFNVSSNNLRSYVSLQGLDESFEDGIRLFEDILEQVQPDKDALKHLIADILSYRQNHLKNKNIILGKAMSNYARFGTVNPFTNVLTEDEFAALQPEQLIDLIRGITDHEHQVFYYGSKDQSSVKAALERYHQLPPKLQSIKPEKAFPYINRTENEVYLLDFPMVQAEVLLMANGTDHFDLDEYIMAQLYNSYFGSGLSSIVFQEIREARALAYSTSASYVPPQRKQEAFLYKAFVGTQPDKLQQALPALLEIIEQMPIEKQQIENARLAILKKIQAERITRSGIFWNYRSVQRRGFQHDIRKDLYERIQTVQPQDLVDFHQQNIQNRSYAILVIGPKKEMDLDFLRSLGKLTELQTSDVFSYGSKP